NPVHDVIRGELGVSGTGSIVGSGGTLYLACSGYPTPCITGQAGAQIAMSGSGSSQLTAPTSGTYKGLAIFYDRANISPIAISGNGGDSLTGTVYGKSAVAELSGTGTG